MKKVEFKFSATLVIEGESFDKIKEKWFKMELFSQEAKDCGVEFADILEVQDPDTCEDLYYEIY